MNFTADTEDSRSVRIYQKLRGLDLQWRFFKNHLIADDGGSADAGVIVDAGGSADDGVIADDGGSADAGVIADDGVSADDGGSADAGVIADDGGRRNFDIMSQFDFVSIRKQTPSTGIRNNCINFGHIH